VLILPTIPSEFSTQTDEVNVALKLWPLFRGRAEIAAVDLARPALTMTVVPEASKPEEAQTAQAQGPLGGYRSIVGVCVAEPRCDVVVGGACREPRWIERNERVLLEIRGVGVSEVEPPRRRGRKARDGARGGQRSSSYGPPRSSARR